MRVLVLGGGGNIGWWLEECLISAGKLVVSVSRAGSRAKRPAISHESIQRFEETVEDFLATIGQKIGDFDVVVDFVCFNAEQASNRIKSLGAFKGIYCLISTVAVYERKAGLNEIQSHSPCNFQPWTYARNKRLVEKLFEQSATNFKLIIARLGHTYDTALPVPFGPANWTVPLHVYGGGYLLSHKRGVSFWSLQHSQDAAYRIMSIVENDNLFGRIVNVASSQTVSWDYICGNILNALDAEIRIKELESKRLQAMFAYWGDSVIFHKQFDECYVGEDIDLLDSICPTPMPLQKGLRCSIEWYRSAEFNRRVTAFDREQYKMLEGEAVAS